MSSENSRRAGRPGCIVAIGASAGALESLEQFFRHLPTDLDAAFVVIQHLDPSQRSLLPELLAAWTPLPVEAAKPGIPLQPGRVYVREPGVILELKDGTFAGHLETEASRERFPINVFMASLAREHGRQAVGIVISGAGSDGTEGLRQVQKAGGRTLVQEPDEARFPGMPRSAIAADVVDRVAPVSKLAVGLSRGLDLESGAVSEREHGAELLRICEILHRKSGHDFSSYKKATVARRVERRLHATLMPDLPAYIELLERDVAEPRALLRDLLIGVTQFFRDLAAFETLEREVVPKLFEKAIGGAVRVWVPACASGEEAYSLAMLLRLHQATRHPDVALQIFATDIDRAAIDAARLAIYPETIAEHVPAEYLQRFFYKHGNGYQVANELREICLFSEHSLLKHPPYSRMGLISCRNLLIYWEPELQSRILPIFHYALNPGGFLFLGPAENVSADHELFKPVDKKHRIFQRQGGLSRQLSTFPVSQVPFRAQATPEPLPQRVQAAGERDVGKAIGAALLANFAPPAFVVNERGEVAYYSGRTERFLELPTGVPSHNLFDLLARSLRPDVHGLLHQSARSKAEVTHHGFVFEKDGVVQRLNLTIKPLSDLVDGPSLFLVVFQEAAPARSKEEALDEGVRPTEASPLVQQLEEELRETRERLQATIEEVKSSNEELLSMNEELQSANEELQTSKEELQSTNEELETVNSELARKIDELDKSNNDLQNFFQGTQVPILFLDREFRIRKFTPQATRIFRLITGDLGRGILDIASTLEGYDEITTDGAKVLESLQPITRELQTKDRTATYLMRVSPYRTMDNVIEGVVVAFSDISDRKRAELESARLAAIVRYSNDAVISKNLQGIVTSWNEAAVRMFGYSAEEMIGRSIKMLIPADRFHEEDVILAAVSRGERIEHYETVRQRKDGTLIDVSVSISPVKDGSGTIVGASKIARDITRQKASEAELREAVRARDEFLSIASHELKTPLTSLRMQAQMRKRSLLKGDLTAFAPEKLRKMVEGDERQILRLSRLVDDMLDVSRIASGKLTYKLEPVVLEEVVRDVAERFQDQLAKAGSSLNLDVQWPAQGHWDRFRIEQVVTNLLSNAIKYGAGKPIVIRIEADEQAARLIVRDQGLGIAPEDQERIFQQFERAISRDEISGMGLGLYIAKEIVEAHQGNIRVESEPGRGSSFIVTLPLHSEPEGAHE